MAQYEEIRQKLERELNEIRERHAKVTRHLRRADSEMPTDSEEQAIYLENDEVLEALDERGRAEFEAIRGALARIDAGSYGRCAACGGEIPVGRLRALPTSTRCVPCAEREA